MKSRFLCWPLAMGLVLALQGCATPGRSQGQMVRVETPGCQPARCELSNDRGRWLVAGTPATVEVMSSSQPLLAMCRSEQGPTASASVSPLPASGSEGAVVGGAVGGATAGAALGGTALSFIPVLGVVVLVTAAAAGAIGGEAIQSQVRVPAYPSLIVIPMTCPVPEGTPAPPAPAAAQPSVTSVR